MTLFDGKRLTQNVMHLPIDGLRRGDYSDKYFANVERVLVGAFKRSLRYGQVTPAKPMPAGYADELVGDVVVEAQIFNRRSPWALVGGVDAALAMVRHATRWDAWAGLEVEAVHDGVLTAYDGQPETVQPVLKIRGKYRDFALLETPMLGVLTRISRVATNVLEVLRVSDGKPILFFPARFDLPDVQASDGYAYWLAVQRYNHETGRQTVARVSTDAQGAWWGGRGGGTIPHALIAAFLGDTAAAMLAVARELDTDTPRIVLADFNNDAIRDALATLDAYWPHYKAAWQGGDQHSMRQWTLNGVRLDTAGNLLDASLSDPADKGVSPSLVRAMRRALDGAWERWNEAGAAAAEAQAYCRRVQIVVTGGFNRERVERFERERVPVDVYGVGSSLLANDKATGTDFTMDVVRAKLGGQWADVAKIGRRAGVNPDLQPVDLGVL
ncbi:MAG: nicotinate phosphoribosyltransferase [Anaerolineae bacterium]|nr:nicotinate phosphoribosyltransferase [Anaerolineae bacterium]